MTTKKTKPSPSPDPNTIFAGLLQDLPPETADLAREFKAFARARKIKTVAELLRAVLLYAGLDHSEREVAANMTLVNPAIRTISDEAISKRLRACQPWLEALLPRLLERDELPALPSGLSLLVIDATDVTAPGETKTTWRLHLMLSLVSLQLVCVHLTDRRSGETLYNFTFQPGEVVMADRGYSHRKGVAHLLECGGQVIVRYNPHQLPVQDRDGKPLDVAAALSDCESGERRTLEAQFTAPSGKTYPVWIHAQRLTGETAEVARRRCRRQGQKCGYTPKQTTLLLAEFVMVMTSISPEVLSAETVLALYRGRWQVELLIKRYKSLLHLDQLRARAGSVRGKVWMLGKLIYAALVERRARRRCGPEWTRLDEERSGTWWRVWKMIQREIAPLITLEQCWVEESWPAALRVLAERRRKRRLQSLPAEVVIWLHQPTQAANKALKMVA